MVSSEVSFCLTASCLAVCYIVRYKTQGRKASTTNEALQVAKTAGFTEILFSVDFAKFYMQTKQKSKKHNVCKLCVLNGKAQDESLQ